MNCAAPSKRRLTPSRYVVHKRLWANNDARACDFRRVNISAMLSAEIPAAYWHTCIKFVGLVTFSLLISVLLQNPALLPRNFRFWCGYIAQFWMTCLATPLMRWLESSFPQCSVNGIKIIDASLPRRDDPRFLTDTVDALRLIESVDPRRYRRIRRHLKQILNTESITFAYYNRLRKQCSVDYGRHTNPEHREWYQWWYATVLVHEATHGTVYAHKIMYTRALRARIERLCHTEAKRFARRADAQDRHWSDALVKPFDERDWYWYWNFTRWQRTKALFQRYREARHQTADQNRK